MDTKVVQHGVQYHFVTGIFVRQAGTFTNHVEILIKHRLKATVLAIQQHILPMGIVISFFGMILAGRQLYDGSGFRGVEITQKQVGQRGCMGDVAAIGAIDAYGRDASAIFVSVSIRSPGIFPNIGGVSASK